MKKLPFYTVDVFTNQPFAGNSLAVVLEADDLSTLQMQMMAREFNLPETIFVQTASDPDNTAKVRIFFPTDEIPFAGHPTIGCAIFLAEQRQNNESDFSTEIRLEEEAGLVPVKVERVEGVITAQFTAPVIPTPVTDADTGDVVALDSKATAQVLGLEESDIGCQGDVSMVHTGGPTFLFIPVSSVEALSRSMAVEPNCSQLAKRFGAVGTYVYYLDPAKNELDARMFAPDAGIPEDPATGSATALLASQLMFGNRLQEGTNTFVLRQGYDMGRPSDLQLEIDVQNATLKAVRVAGSSVAISSGQIRVP